MRAFSALFIVASLSLAGCSQVYVPSFIQVYQPDIQQGNVLDAEDVARIYPGMYKQQVRDVLGTPSLETIFHGDRWIYVYYDKRGKQKAFQHILAIYFDEDRVERIEQVGDPLPVDRDGNVI